MGVRGMTLNGRQLVVRTRPLIDIVSDPVARVRRPDEWEKALVELTAIMQDKRQWNVFRPKAGCRTTHATNNIGDGRLAWLREFCTDELGYTPPRIRTNGGRRR